MREFAKYTDLSGQDIELGGHYHGVHNPYLETMLLVQTEDGLRVGVSLWEEEIAASRYHPERRSLDLLYQAPPPDQIRILGLSFTPFEVPKDIKEINVFDQEQGFPED